MNVTKTMEVAVKSAQTHLVAMNVLVKQVIHWILMVLTALVGTSYVIVCI